MMDGLGIALRSGLVALMLLTAALVWRQRGDNLALKLAAAFAIGVAAHVTMSAPAWQPPYAAWLIPVSALSAGNALMFWLFARALFDDDGFGLRPWHVALWAVLAGAGALTCALWQPAPAGWLRLIALGITLATAAFALLAAFQALATWRVDLVERRRRLRGFIVGAGTLYSLVQFGARVGGVPGSAALGLIDVLALLAIALPVLWQVLAVRPEGLLSTPTPLPAPADDAAAAPAEIDAALLAALEKTMTEQQAYREEGLSISLLALRLNVPDYKLRRLINQGLGHRNFNAFVNGYRLAEVRRALADPALADTPILSLALGAGFQSIGPFNRAFKAATGLTPTEFRRQPSAKT